MRTSLFVACSLLALPSFGYQLRRDSQGDVVRWNGAVRFVVDERLEVVLGVPGAGAAVEAALAEAGTAAPKVALRTARGHAAELGYHPEDGAWGNTVVALDAWPFERGNVAATVVTVDTRANEILDADIAFNAEEYAFAVLERPQANARVHDVQTVFTHELGHALGLQHEALEPEAVMYPAATPGQLAKRALAPDDRGGLQALYGEAWVAPVETPEEVAAGCAAAPGGMVEGLVAVLAAYCSRRRRTPRSGEAPVAAAPAGSPQRRASGDRGPRAPRKAGRSARRAVPVATMLVLLAAPALAAEPELPLRVGPEVERAVLGEVVSARSSWVDTGRRLMVTEVEVRVDGCLKGACERTVLLRRPGGRIGDLEQSVDHQPVLAPGDAVVLTWTQGRLRLAGHLPRVRALPGR